VVMMMIHYFVRGRTNATYPPTHQGGPLESPAVPKVAPRHFAASTKKMAPSHGC
jgi:hypothetical protein